MTNLSIFQILTPTMSQAIQSEKVTITTITIVRRIRIKIIRSKTKSNKKWVLPSINSLFKTIAVAASKVALSSELEKETIRMTETEAQ